LALCGQALIRLGRALVRGGRWAGERKAGAGTSLTCPILS
jgi:hypothetical protein